MNNLDYAKKMLEEHGCTCAAYDGRYLYESSERGVKPLLALLDEGRLLRGFSVADRVVGRAAAFLYVLLGASEVFARVVSEPALDVFRQFGIPAAYLEKVDAIFNRTGTGLCPMESAVIGIASPDEAERAVRKRLAEISAEAQK